MKLLILQSYELVPEAYHQKSHKREKRNDQTYVEFFRGKEHLCDRWCISTKVDGDFDNYIS